MRQGEVWMVDFGPPFGPEQAGQRPSIVRQDYILNDALVTVIVVPVTTNLKRLLKPSTGVVAFLRATRYTVTSGLIMRFFFSTGGIEQIIRRPSA
jgi:mRNA-degrading endonuclease toxin of MazEF toxin-antitoxin module